MGRPASPCGVFVGRGWADLPSRSWMGRPASPCGVSFWANVPRRSAPLFSLLCSCFAHVASLILCAVSANFCGHSRSDARGPLTVWTLMILSVMSLMLSDDVMNDDVRIAVSMSDICEAGCPVWGGRFSCGLEVDTCSPQPGGGSLQFGSHTAAPSRGSPLLKVFGGPLRPAFCESGRMMAEDAMSSL